MPLKWVLKLKNIWDPEKDHSVQLYPSSIVLSLSFYLMSGNLSYSKLTKLLLYLLLPTTPALMSASRAQLSELIYVKQEKSVLCIKSAVYILTIVLLLLLSLLHYATALIVRDLWQNQSRKSTPIIAARSAP